MEGLARKEEFCFQGRSPIGFDKFQVTIFVRAVDFVADDRISGMCEMHTDLMGSTSFWFGFDQGERTVAQSETVQDTKRGEGRGSVGIDGLFQIDLRWANDSLPQKGLVDDESFLSRRTEHDRGIDLANAVLSDHETQLPGCIAGFCDENQAAGFTIEPVDERDAWRR